MRRLTHPPRLSLPVTASFSRRRLWGHALGGAGLLYAGPGLWRADTAIAQERAPGTAPVSDWDVPDGHFYTQGAPAEAPADSGFVVADADGISFWSAYKSLGGPAQLGYPVTARYSEGRHAYQVMQAGVLRWDGDAGAADVHPVFIALSELNLDGWLEAKGIPPVAEPLRADPGLAQDRRMEWLSHPVLRSAYMTSDGETSRRRFGLPMSEPQRFGPYMAQRFEKAVLQLWLDATPDTPAPGAVTVVQVGELLTAAGLVPEAAQIPQVPPVPRPVVEAPRPAIVPVSAPVPAPASAPAAPGRGKQIVVSLGRQTWYAYENGQVVYSGPTTTGRPELATPTGSFSVLSRHTPYTMYSPWPRGSAFWYEPSSMTYALRITGNGVFLHDAPWRPFYGPGTNVPHTGADGVWRTGSHGCINLPYAAAAWLWGFAPIGTPVQVSV